MKACFVLVARVGVAEDGGRVRMYDEYMTSTPQMFEGRSVISVDAPDQFSLK